MTILAMVVVLGVLIFVHELGHFGAAKLVGIEVQRFSIGLGPKILGFKAGETEYVLSAIPLGGYVKMGGMDDEVMERVEGGSAESPRLPKDSDFDRKPIWARTLVIVAGVTMNMLFAFAAFTFVAAKWGTLDFATTRLGSVDAETLPVGAEALADLTPGSRIARIAGRDMTDWSSVMDALLDAPDGPVAIELEEPLRTVEIRVPPSESDRLALVRSLHPWVEAGVGDLLPGEPAEQGGLETGDHITSVDGTPVQTWWEVVREIERRPGERVEIALERNGRPLVRVVEVGRQRVERPGGGAAEVGKIGMYQPLSPMTIARASLGEAVVQGYRETVGYTGLTLAFLRDFVLGRVSPRSVGSIIAIGQQSGQAAREGIDVFIRFMALLSVNLAVLNLLPIPVLDGGHLVFLGIEAVRGGRAVSIEQRLKWSNVGFIVLMGIMLWALSSDILRYFGL